VPGGVDEYLRILDERGEAQVEARTEERRVNQSKVCPLGGTPDEGHKPVLPRAEEYALKKELASTERKLDTLGKKADAIRIELQEADPSDYLALVDGQARLQDVEQQTSDLEDVWVALCERLS
jgi:hypothetical protein